MRNEREPEDQLRYSFPISGGSAMEYANTNQEGDMNAKNSSIVRASLALTSLVVCGAFAIFGTSCAGSDKDTSGTGGTGGTGGAAASGDTVTFKDGQAQGPMTGFAFVALGLQNTITDPVCSPTATKGEQTQQISKTTPCPTTGQTVWNSPSKLCMSGTIPVVVGGDYTSDWGVQIGVNTSNPPADTSGNGKTLGTSYSTLALTINPSAVTPANTAIRAGVHLVSMAVEADPYCATITASGAPLKLTDFNTQCWAGTTCKNPAPTCLQLQASDVPNIDKVLVQISSDISLLYTVSDFCLESIAFGK